MKALNVVKKYAPVVAAAALPALSFAADGDLDAAQLTAGITSAKPIIIAIASAVFTLVGIIVAISYSKRAAK